MQPQSMLGGESKSAGVCAALCCALMRFLPCQLQLGGVQCLLRKNDQIVT